VVDRRHRRDRASSPESELLTAEARRTAKIGKGQNRRILVQDRGIWWSGHRKGKSENLNADKHWWETL